MWTVIELPALDGKREHAAERREFARSVMSAAGVASSGRLGAAHRSREVLFFEAGADSPDGAGELVG